MNVIEKAVAANLYFDELGGHQTTQDLYHQNLKTLNELYGQLRKKQESTNTYSLLETRTTADNTLQLKVDVVKHVVEHLMAQKEAKKLNAEKASRRAILKGLLEKKEMESLENMSAKDIEKQLAELT